MRRFCALTTGAVFLVGASVTAVPGAGAVPRGACDRPVLVTTLAFGPSVVAPGGTSTVRLSGRNCSRREQQVTVTWIGTFTGDRTGCPAIDPVARALTIPRGAGLRDQQTYLVLSGCAADKLSVTARVTDKTGKRIKQKTADLRIVQKAKTGGSGY